MRGAGGGKRFLEAGLGSPQSHASDRGIWLEQQATAESSASLRQREGAGPGLGLVLGGPRRS